MSSQFSTRSRRLAPLAAALALLVALVATPMASADTSGEVTVTASVTNESLSLTLCDTEANFGTGLNSHGATPQNTNDAVSATTEGTNPGEGVYYKWIPSCQANGTGNFFTVEGNTSWAFSACMNGNQGSNSDLSNFDLLKVYYNFSTYENVDIFTGYEFELCPPPPWYSGGDGDFSFPIYYYLRIDDNVGDGTFETVTTWSVIPT